MMSSCVERLEGVRVNRFGPAVRPEQLFVLVSRSVPSLLLSRKTLRAFSALPGVLRDVRRLAHPFPLQHQVLPVWSWR